MSYIEAGRKFTYCKNQTKITVHNLEVPQLLDTTQRIVVEIWPRVTSIYTLTVMYDLGKVDDIKTL
jgi:hypothetical protein